MECVGDAIYTCLFGEHKREDCCWAFRIDENKKYCIRPEWYMLSRIISEILRFFCPRLLLRNMIHIAKLNKKKRKISFENQFECREASLMMQHSIKFEMGEILHADHHNDGACVYIYITRNSAK